LGLIGQETGDEYLSYHFDFRGSTVALTDSSGQVTESFQYSPYGLLLSGDASKTPFLFNGMYGVMTDSNHLYYMRARFYSPEIKRFINQDILLGDIVEGQTLNRYAFVTGRPVSFVDPFGLFARSPSRRVRRGLYRDLTGEGVLELLEWEKAGPPPFPYPIVPVINPIEIPNTTRRNKDNIWKYYDGFPLECRENQRDKCTAILMEMYAVIYIRRVSSGSNTQGLQNRYLTQLADLGNFYEDSPKKWDDHNKKITEATDKLQRLIKQAKKMGCTIPDEIIMWSQILPPSFPRR